MPRFARLALVLLAATELVACCRLTGNFGGGPCPRSRPAERRFQLDLDPSCAPTTELWFEAYGPDVGPALEQGAFDARRGAWSGVGDLAAGRETAVRADRVTIWAHAPGARDFVPFGAPLGYFGRTRRVLACRDGGRPTELR